MKARWVLLTVLAVAACDDSTGVMVPFTDNGGAVVGSSVVAVRGVVTGPGGAIVTGAVVRITVVPVDANSLCSGTARTGNATTSASGEFRIQVTLPDALTNVCVTANITPPAGSNLRASSVDLGRVAPFVVTSGATVPEVQANVQLTP
jgi:hypothetical protein